MPSAAILPASLTIPRHSNQSLSSCRALTGAYFFRPSYFAAAVDLPSAAIICMGGGPRTFPGGVSKWQWKRMQMKKSKQLLKARLCRERQLYEMRKRAELKAAISELERPWEVVERSPVLFSVSADEQVKVLADRFQCPTGFDMWSERDGPQLFRSPDNLPSARFFPKGAVHSLKPYSAVAGEMPDGGGGSDEGGKAMRYNDWIARGAGGIGTGSRVKRVSSESKLSPDSGKSVDGDTGESLGSYCSDSEILLTDLKKEEEEWHDQNHGLHGSDMEIGVADLNKEEDEIAGEYDWDISRSRVPHFSDSELELAESRMEGHKRAGGIRQRDGREGRGWNRNTHQSNSALPVSGSRKEGNGMSSEFGRRSGRNSNQSGFDQHGGRGGYSGRNVNRSFNRSNSMLQNQVSRITNSEIRIDGSRTNGREMAGGFNRRDGRGGRGGYRSSYRSYSDSAVDNFSRHRDIGRSRDSRGSHSDHPVADWRMEAGDIAGSFEGRGGHRGRHWNRDSYETYSNHGSRTKGDSLARRGGYRSSYRSYSDSAVDNFSRHRDIGRSLDSRGSNSDRPVADWRMEAGDIAGSFDGRGGHRGNRNSYETYSDHSSRTKGDSFVRRGGRGKFHGSYDSEIDDGSSKGGEMAGSFVRPGGGRGYKNSGSHLLRPTTQLRLEGGGRGRRGRK